MSAIRVLSLGAGVQSSTLALMIAHGEVDPVDAAIFADTGAEPRAVYEWLDWLETRLPFPVHRVSHGNIRDDVLASVAGGRFAGAPFYTESESVGGGMLRRQCTREYKVTPITRKVRELVGLKKGQRAPKGATLATQLIGISLDEVRRMKPSRQPWIEHRWPLVDRGMSRWDCKRWMVANNYPEPPRSACTFCPYRSNAEWRAMKTEDPEAWADAVAMDEAIRGGVRGTSQRLYVHQTLRPLAEVDLRSAEDLGQVNMFDNECEGMCGV